LTGLVKRYGGTEAVRGLSFRVERGDLFGFIGANGAGKTSTLRILATFLVPDGGAARVFGHDVVAEAHRVRHLIGYMPDHFGLYKDMRVGEFIEFFAAAYGLPPEERAAVRTKVLDAVLLGDRCGAMIATLSRGMQQRLALARALVHDPPLLILDEPASGLDPRSRIEMMDLLKQLQGAGKTIFLSSHILGELEGLCNRLAILDRGRLAFCGTLPELRHTIQHARQVHVEVADRRDEACQLLSARPEVESVVLEGAGLQLRLRPGVADHTFVANCLVEHGLKLVALRERAAPLEELFLRVTTERQRP
jgi:ABC-2 type transport system ATP-binding protein